MAATVYLHRLQPGTHQKIIDMAMNAGCRASARIMGVGFKYDFTALKNSGRSRYSRAYSRAVTSSSARKWTNSGATSGLNRGSAGCFTRMTGSGRRLRNVFGERTIATLERLMMPAVTLWVIWMTDGWPLYESRLKGKLHVISKRYTQRNERHNLNLRQHLARLDGSRCRSQNRWSCMTKSSGII